MSFIANYYYISLILQAICVIHCIRRGNQNKWIWIIVFLPVIGCLVYIFSEILTGRELRQVSSGMGAVLNPSASVRKLEEQLRFSDTFQNRIALADAYLQKGETQKAIELYESSHTGVFTENEHLLRQLIIAYNAVGRYDDIIPLAQKIYRSPQFARSRAHLLYAIALDKTGRPEQAEKEFQTMAGRFGYYEQRYYYGLFLIRGGREQEATRLFNAIVEEGRHLSSQERSMNREWISRAKDELNRK
ncbi:MAG: hypothetical protein E6Q24_13105 [Chitinophagaceae bacterium]|jgi:hypothetical protein|nr:MAG: hypothetical protein E6Q24_13105 [Chitinophagaceae bacterium]